MICSWKAGALHPIQVLRVKAKAAADRVKRNVVQGEPGAPAAPTGTPIPQSAPLATAEGPGPAQTSNVQPLAHAGSSEILEQSLPTHA